MNDEVLLLLFETQAPLIPYGINGDPFPKEFIDHELTLIELEELSNLYIDNNTTLLDVKGSENIVVIDNMNLEVTLKKNKIKKPGNWDSVKYLTIVAEVLKTKYDFFDHSELYDWKELYTLIGDLDLLKLELDKVLELEGIDVVILVTDTTNRN